MYIYARLSRWILHEARARACVNDFIEVCATIGGFINTRRVLPAVALQCVMEMRVYERTDVRLLLVCKRELHV